MGGQTSNLNSHSAQRELLSKRRSPRIRGNPNPGKVIPVQTLVNPPGSRKIKLSNPDLPPISKKRLPRNCVKPLSLNQVQSDPPVSPQRNLPSPSSPPSTQLPKSRQKCQHGKRPYVCPACGGKGIC